MIHTATLLHDDVVDESKLRRGHATANATFGNAASVLVGDFLYSRAFQLMVGAGSMRVLEILSQATNVIAEGEVLQLMNSGNPDLDEAAYLTVIHRKTAKLFEAAAQLGAVLGGDRGTRGRAGRLRHAPRHLVPAGRRRARLFRDQIEIGKNLGDDLAEGKMTLPLIRAIAVGRAATPRDSRGDHHGRLTEFAAVMDVLARTGALDYARSAVRESERPRPAWPACRSPQRKVCYNWRFRGRAQVLKQRAIGIAAGPRTCRYSRRGAAQKSVPATANRGVA